MSIFDYSKEYQWLYVSGDIHGEFESLVYNIRQQHITNAVVIAAGDCGFGFEKPEHYKQEYGKLSAKLRAANLMLIMVRGNHDDPEYFEKRLIDFPRMKAIPDYSVVIAGGRNILCVGGAISLDRSMRLQEMQMAQEQGKAEEPCYWRNEAPFYSENELARLRESGIKIDAVVTHTAPSFCYPPTKRGLDSWGEEDSCLMADVKCERQTMSMLHDQLLADKHPVRDWVYGHFHIDYTEDINNVCYTLLGIEELKLLS